MDRTRERRRHARLAGVTTLLGLPGLLALGESATLVWLPACGAREPSPSALRPAYP